MTQSEAVLEIFSTKHVPGIHITMVDLVPDKCGYELEMNGQTKTPDHIEPHWTKVIFWVFHDSNWRFEIQTSQIATPNSKLRAFFMFGSSAPVGLLHCASHMKPTQQCTKQLIIALVQRRGQTWISWQFTIISPRIETNKLVETRKKQTSKTLKIKCSFHAVRLHACVRQLDSLEVALVTVSWWKPNCGRHASLECSAKSNLFLSNSRKKSEITHFFYSPRRTTTCQNISGKSTKRVFFVTWPRESRRFHHPLWSSCVQLRSWQLCPVQAKALVTNRMGYLDWNKNNKLNKTRKN